MTSLAEGAKAHGRGRVLWLVLAASLALNVFFVGAMVWLRMTGDAMLTPEQRFEQVASELGLDADQRASFREFADHVRSETRRLRQSDEPLLKGVWDEMGKPQPDQALIAQMVDQATDHRRAYQREMTAALSGFLGKLTPTQRARFIELAQRHKDPVGWRIRRLVTP
jgi:uncharacterized membrane protein